MLFRVLEPKILHFIANRLWEPKQRTGCFKRDYLGTVFSQEYFWVDKIPGKLLGRFALFLPFAL